MKLIYQRRFTLLAILTGLLLLGGCASVPHNEYVEGTDFSRYQTFSWAPRDVHTVDDPILDLQILNQRVERAVRGVLLSRGYTEVKDNPDMLVTYHAASKERIRAVGYGIGLGYHSYSAYWRHSIHFAAPEYDTYEEGVFIIDVVDHQQDRLVWRGWDTAALTQENFSESQVLFMTQKILSGFPPLR